jgi:hypothetical protein
MGLVTYKKCHKRSLCILKRGQEGEQCGARALCEDPETVVLFLSYICYINIYIWKRQKSKNVTLKVNQEIHSDCHAISIESSHLPHGQL